MAAGGLHISISAETLFHIGEVAVTNSMLTSVIASVILITFAAKVAASFKETGKPTGIQNFAEWIVEMFYNLILSVTGSKKKTEQFLPLIASFFLFIVMNNWLGLLPGVGTIGFIEGGEGEHASIVSSARASTEVAPVIHDSEPIQYMEGTEDPAATGVIEDHETTTEEGALHEDTTENAEHAEDATSHAVFVPLFRAGTADLNMTIALAIFSQLYVQFMGFRYLGAGYLKKFFNFSSPIMFFVGMLEFMGEFTKVISYAFRLFGNVFAGEVLLTVIAFLVPVVVPMPFYAMELFVGMIQGLVFAMLSVVFVNMATVSHDEH